MSRLLLAVGTALAIGFALVAVAQDKAGPSTIGWRFDGSGRYPDATPPVVWGRSSKGVVRELRSQAAKPKAGDEETAPLLRQNLIYQWLVLGPVTSSAAPADGASAALDAESVPNEAVLQPDEGDKSAGLEWKLVNVPYKGEKDWWINEPDSLDLTGVLKGSDAQGSCAYAHAYLHSKGEGVVSFCVDHSAALKVWVNGKVAYDNPQPRFTFGAFSMLDVAVCSMGDPPAASNRFTARLNRGWNRLLLKALRQKGRGAAILLKLSDDPSGAYETKNIRWTAKLPSWGWSDPVIVGDKLFLLTDDEEILCLDKRTGKVLWQRMETFVDAATGQEKAAKAVFKEKLEPLVVELKATDDPDKRRVLRRQMRDLLAGVDKDRYRFMTYNQRTVDGYANCTPATDGKNIYAFFGSGTAVCWDLNGNRKWSRRIVLKPEEHGCYAPSVLAGDKFVVVTNSAETGTVAFNKETGEEVWTNHAFGHFYSLGLARLAGRDILYNGASSIYIDAADGRLLTMAERCTMGNLGTAFGNTVYFMRYGEMGIARFSEENDQAIKPRVSFVGCFGDTFYVSQPLYYDGLVYMTDIFGNLCAVDPEKRRVVYKRKTDLEPLVNYHSAGVAAGPILAGKYLYLSDNQGNTIVFEPGREFKQVALNRIENILPRRYALEPPQELIGYSQPVFDGDHIYIRGEGRLYCIGRN